MTTRRMKRPFDIPAAMRILRAAVKLYPKAAMFELADRGFDSVFEQLVACIISIRTLEEVTIPTALRLFETARTPKGVAALNAVTIDGLIRTCTFHGPKSRAIRDIAIAAQKQFGGELPCDFEAL